MIGSMDVDAYLVRIGAARPSTPTAEALDDLHEAHLRAVPFEDYDIHTGTPISLDLGDLYAKIVTRHRGGFCYELNGLFAALLRSLGFDVTLLSAFTVDDDGVRRADFEHLRLRVETPDGPMLADVGNARRELRAIPLEPGEYGAVRVHHDGDLWWTSDQHSDGRWERDWSWTAQPRQLADFTDRCRYQQHNPASHFVARRLASMPAGDGRISMLNGVFAETDGAGHRTERRLTAAEERAVLAERFGLVIEVPWRELPAVPAG